MTVYHGSAEIIKMPDVLHSYRPLDFEKRGIKYEQNVLEEIYHEKLEERLIEYISEKHSVDYSTAMKIYYNSNLAEKIHEGRYGVQYLDHKVLVKILEETEPELF